MDKQPDSNTPAGFESIIGLLDNAVVVLDSEQHITYLNPAAQSLLQSSDHIVGQSLTEVIKQCYGLDLVLSPLPETPIQLEIDGETRSFQLQQKKLPDFDGSLILFDDVTVTIELKRLQDDYSDFAHTVAHDVKGPLGVAIGYSNMLQGDLEDNTEARIFADEIFDNSMRIMYICGELVVLAELGHSKLVDLTSVNWRASIENGLHRFEKEIQTNNITIEIPETIPLVCGNAAWLDEVMVNFLHLFINEITNTTHITFEAVKEKGMLQLRIRHNGTPMPADEQATLFKHDRPLDQVRAQGHGLGIDIAARLIERLGGQLMFDDASTLVCSLPLDD